VKLGGYTVLDTLYMYFLIIIIVNFNILPLS